MQHCHGGFPLKAVHRDLKPHLLGTYARYARTHRGVSRSAEKPGLILMDIKLPYMDGRQLLFEYFGFHGKAVWASGQNSKN